MLWKALIECIAKVTKNCRFKGLEFPKGKEYSFDEIPAL
jgi:hypothetical protein